MQTIWYLCLLHTHMIHGREKSETKSRKKNREKKYNCMGGVSYVLLLVITINDDGIRHISTLIKCHIFYSSYSHFNAVGFLVPYTQVNSMTRFLIPYFETRNICFFQLRSIQSLDSKRVQVNGTVVKQGHLPGNKEKY